MVALRVKSDSGEAKRPPDIYQAAIDDDVAELARALEDGQKLDELRKGYVTTAVHLACAHRSMSFLEVAMGHDFNPWVRDQNDRLAMDHAIAQRLTAIAEGLYSKMYEGKWQIENVAQLPDSDPQI